MKKFLPYLMAIAVVTTILFLPGKADASCGWIPYDYFIKPDINLEKWDVKENTADIYIENGMVCFEHPDEPYPGETSNWLLSRNTWKNLEVSELTYL